MVEGGVIQEWRGVQAGVDGMLKGEEWGKRELVEGGDRRRWRCCVQAAAAGRLHADN